MKIADTSFNCCLIHITIIILRHFVFSIFVFMSRFIFSLIFIVINHIISFKQTYLFPVLFLEHLLLFLDDKVDEESEKFSNSKSSVSGCCLAFAWFFANFSLALLTKLSYIKKRVYHHVNENMMPLPIEFSKILEWLMKGVKKRLVRKSSINLKVRKKMTKNT